MEVLGWIVIGIMSAAWLGFFHQRAKTGPPPDRPPAVPQQSAPHRRSRPRSLWLDYR